MLPLPPTVNGSSRKLRETCANLASEATHQARRTDHQEKLESELREASATLALAEGRADDLAERLGGIESASRVLQLHLKVQVRRVTFTTYPGTVLRYWQTVAVLTDKSEKWERSLK